MKITSRAIPAMLVLLLGLGAFVTAATAEVPGVTPRPSNAKKSKAAKKGNSSPHSELLAIAVYGLIAGFVNTHSAETKLGTFIASTQPLDAVVLTQGYRIAPFNGRSEGTLRTYILNTALKQILPGSQQEVNAPNLVDFLDDTGYEARIDIDRGSTAYYEPSDMTLSQDGRRLVVSARGSDRAFFPNNPVPPHLDVIDTATAAYVKRIPFPETLWPTSVELSPDGQLAYISMTTLNGTQITGQQAIHLVNIESGATIGTIPLPDGGRTGEMAITPDGALLFVMANLDSARLYEIDLRSRTIAATISGSPVLMPNVQALRESTNLAINPQGTKLYLIDAATPQTANDFTTVGVGVVDIATATLVDLIAIPGTTRRGSGDDIQTAHGGRVIVAMDGVSGLLTFIDAASRQTIRQVDIGDAISRTTLTEGP